MLIFSGGFVGLYGALLGAWRGTSPVLLWACSLGPVVGVEFELLESCRYGLIPRWWPYHGGGWGAGLGT